MSNTIGICAFYRKDQFASGAYSFSENLLRGLANVQDTMDAAQRAKLVVFTGRAGLPLVDGRLEYRQLSDRRGRWPAETRAALVDSKGFAAMLFSNSFTPPVIRARRAVTVIHDLQYVHMPEYWPAPRRVWMRACHEFSLRRCDAVVAISQAVKDDILKQYGAKWESRVHAVWNPVSVDRFQSNEQFDISGGRPYILCAAVDRPAKNLSTLIRAFKLLRPRFPEHCLVLAGQLRSANRAWRRSNAEIEAKLPAAVDLVRDLDLTEHVITSGFVSDAKLGALFHGASLFVLPSLFEGFGMPAVESLAMGVPTLVSGLPVLREVTLGGACYVENPIDEHEMADRMAGMLQAGDAARPAPEFCQKVREQFSPETIARQYLKLLLGN